jgi:ABC-2 type transport system permease protein
MVADNDRMSGGGVLARAWGLGSVYGKTMRDSRWAIIGFGSTLSLIMLVTASQIVAEFATAESRQLLAAQMGALPELFQGLLGEPINIETLGGFMSWRALGFMAVVLGIWSVVSLSGTLAGEAARGSMEMVAATPLSRTSIAVQKAAGHLVAMGLAMVLVGVACWLWSVMFATLPGDEVSLASGLAAAAAVGVEALVGGAAAFAAAPAVGRGAAAAVGAVVLFGSYVVNGYAATVPAFDAIRPLSYFSWTAGHRPMAGATEWPAFLALAAVVLVLLAVGVVAFGRLDIGRTVGAIRVPVPGFGLGGPLGRSFAERLPAALGWGAGIGLYGLAIASSASALAEQLGRIPQIQEIIRRFLPNADFSSSSGILQLTFFGFGSVLMGLAAATMVAGWASDEGERRLETILGAPLTRFRWALLSGAGVIGAVAVLGLLVAALVAAGASLDGNDPGLPFAGILVVGLYAAALAGIGLAVGGVLRASAAAVVVAVCVIGFYLLDFLGAALQLPDAILSLSLTRHLGRPLLGSWDVPGMVACGVLAVGGVLVAAAGMARRDLAG